MRLSDIAYYVDDNISSDCIELNQYITTDNLLQNKEGRTLASNLPPKACNLTHFLPGDVLIANIRPYLKKVWKADIEGGCSKDVLVIRPKEGHNADYLYSVALQDAFFDNAMLGNKGTQMPRGDKNKIMDLPILEQTDKEAYIGKIISEIQEKISLNTRINAELETMAKQLYDYWFVQFDFPDKNGKPYKSSGGKMVWNEKLKREIPEGWEVKNAKNICQIKTGKEDANFSVENGKYPFFTCSREILKCNSFYFDGHAILIAGNGDFNVKHYTGKFNAYQRTYVLIPENICYFGVLYFNAQDRISSFHKVSNGSIVKFIKLGDVEDLVVFKQNNIELYVTINEILYSIEKRMIEIEKFTHLRDSLLPMLMNGQVTIE